MSRPRSDETIKEFGHNFVYGEQALARYKYREKEIKCLTQAENVAGELNEALEAARTDLHNIAAAVDKLAPSLGKILLTQRYVLGKTVAEICADNFIVNATYYYNVNPLICEVGENLYKIEHN